MGVLVLSVGLVCGEWLSRRERLLLGEVAAAAEDALGLFWVVKRSLIVLPECFRFLSPGLDIGRRGLGDVGKLGDVLTKLR